ncbi:MAG: hypothetical protein J1D86_08160 [Alistipes sp.]|nr:hypothetical protein [Alistipes sp.]
MRNLKYILLPLAAAFLLGCISEDTADPDDVRGDVRISMAIPTAMSQSEGEDAYNENAIHRASIFFYPIDSDDDTPAVYRYTDNSISAARSHEVYFRADADLRVKIFPNDNPARAFAVVNLPEGFAIDDKATVNQIRDLIVTADFRETVVQPDFLMLGQSTVEFDKTTKQATGEIPIKRTAAKIRLALTIDNNVEDYDPEDPGNVVRRWEPLVEGMRVYITNGVRRAHAGGAQLQRSELEALDPAEDDGQNPDDDGYTPPVQQNGYYKISASGSTSSSNPDDFVNDFQTLARRVTKTSPFTDEADYYPYWHDDPLYSYPHQWENTPYEDRQTYLVVQVPWKAEGEQIYKTFFYQVPVNLRGGSVQDSDGSKWDIDGNTIESNMYYIVKLHVGMLGSFNPEEPLTIEAAYYVVPWQTEDIEADLRSTRYLVVNETNWTMHNTSDQDIQFYSSHETVVARIKYRFWNFNPVQGTYTDDGETYNISHDGAPLRRTIVWERDGDNTIFNRSIEQSMAEDDRSTAIQADSIFSWSIDNRNFMLHYHHDLLRWTEYTTTSSGAELPVFGTQSVGPHQRIGTNVSPYTGTNAPGPVDVSGFYGKYNGATQYLKKSRNPDYPERYINEWSIISVEITIIHKDLFEQGGHLDNTRFQQTIYIVQYPQMYIESEESSGGTSGTTFVNNNRSASGNWDNITAANIAATNNNPNMYIVTITQLDEDSQLQIGDPRSLTVNNLLSSASMASGSQARWNSNIYNAEDVYYILDETGANRYDWPHYNFANRATDTPARDAYGNDLSNYYPTDESGMKDNYVAPKLRIASSFGNTGGNFGAEMARRRCAAYQEGGYPAGRWRLPTRAEIEFISQLSRDGRIPLLFTPWHAQAIYMGKPIVHAQGDGRSTAPYGSPYLNYPHYWCSQGAAYINNDNSGAVEMYPAELYKLYGTGDVFNNRPTDNPRAASTNTSNAVQVAVRCVYDEWYWEDKAQNPNVFEWGDKEKASPR